MNRFCAVFRLVSVLTAIIFFASYSPAQKSKPKPSPVKPASAAQTTGPSLSPLEIQVVNEIAALRADPPSYIKYLEQMKAGYKGTFLTLSTGEKLITGEGAAGVDDAIAALKNTRPLTVFKLSTGLAKAANEHLMDLIKNNITGHKGSDGSWPPNRVDHYGFWSGEVKENISYRAKTARDMVLNMLIDDGNPKREHRKNLLSANLKFIGLSTGDGRSYGKMCVVVFAVDFTEKKTGK